MNTIPEQSSTSPGDSPSTSVWLRRSLIALTVLFWIIIGAIILFGLGAIVDPLILLLISTAIAYVLFPLVKILRRFMPRLLAILATYVVVLIGVILLFYFIAVPLIGQLVSLIDSLHKYNQELLAGQTTALTQFLNDLGISTEFLIQSNLVATAQLEHLISGLLPLVGSAFTILIEVIIVSTVSIYLIVDGPRVINWLKNGTPLKQRATITLLVESVDKIVGGLLRGVLFLATMMAIVTAVGATLIGVPYAVLIGVIVFIFEFVPQVGAYISGFIGVLFAATQGWEVALIYAIFASVVQGILDAQILAPRIMGHAVGLHPVVSLFAMLIFGALFGLLGAILAIPIAGVASVFVYASWNAWRESHPEQFPGEKKEEEKQGVAAPEVGVVET
jgi:predicted PurR-regulated permease PerM